MPATEAPVNPSKQHEFAEGRSKRSLVFRKVIGGRVDVPLDQVVAVRQDKWFMKNYRGGREHLILKTRSGIEVGFFVHDLPAWMTRLRAISERSSALA